MAHGNLGLFRRVNESFWLEFGPHTVQVRISDAGGRALTSWARMIISAPSEVKIHREQEWIGGEAPVRKIRPKSAQQAIMSALTAAGSAWLPTTTGEQMDTVKMGMICRELMLDLEGLGFAVSNREQKGN